jgi:hypothetical protein
MSGVATRLTGILLLAGLVVVVNASGGAAASSSRAPILGVVGHSSRPARTLHSARTLSALTSPAFLAFDGNYESVINRYLADVAHDSGLNTNVYSVATQYIDGGGIQYQSAVGGSVVAHDPLPASGCSDGLDSVCLDDSQLQAEIQRVLTAQGWHGSTSTIFFLMTPRGVGSCFDSLGSQCSTNVFCAYHSSFTDTSSEPVIYANEPYQATISGCSSGSSPNGDDADTTINTLSHEHNEAITDPFGDAWFSDVSSEGENGDLCAWTFGTALGHALNGQQYNQLINGHDYWLQQEYSNAANQATPGSGCVQELGGLSSAGGDGDGSGPLVYHGGQVMHTNTTYAIYWLPRPGNSKLPALSGTAAVKQKLTSTSGSWNGSPSGYAYQWQRCSTSSTGCVDIASATAPKYTLTGADGGTYVRSTVSAANVNGTAASVASAGKLVVGFPQSKQAPHVSGHAVIGRKLSASKGSWSGAPKTFAFQWLRCNAKGGSCVAVGNATHSSYRPAARDAGHRLRVRVKAANAAGSRTATSSATSRVSAKR